MALSKEETERFRQESQKSKNRIDVTLAKKSSKNALLISIFAVVLIVAIAGASFSYINSKKPAPLDEFAKCLTEKGAVMYGAYWCQYTQAQKRMFGNSMKFINYKDFTDNKEVKKTPTWFIDGEKYENVQSFDRLAAITGCSIKG